MNEFSAPTPADDQVTQPIRRPRRHRDSTEVMSLDDLLEVAGPGPATTDTRPARTAPAPPRPSVPPRPAVAPGPPVQPRTAAAPRRTGSPTWRRLQQDLTAAGAGAIRTTSAWLDIGDNALVVATAALALFLLLAIGML
ncbi:MAG TPA: hypothetical protein VFT62_11020 [Mycobacteriales bacterium]|nr:hypothetical protein [Mycobacteriales bacterium]